MNEKEIEERIQRAVQGVWVLESRKMRDGKTLKPPEISAVAAYTPQYAITHYVTKEEYGSTLEEYAISGSKVTIRRISAISSNPIWEDKIKATTKFHKREIEAKLDGQKVRFGTVVYEGNKCINSEEGFTDTYKRIELL